jgi:hypothetical protein
LPEIANSEQAGTAGGLSVLLAALALLTFSLLIFWPGVAEYDTVQQYRQVLLGSYSDWHPPVMARLWAMLTALGPGTGPMLFLQLAGYWLGLGILARSLNDHGKAIALLAVGAFPPFLGWLAVVLKDGQLVAAMVCATGLVGQYRLRNRPIPVPALIGAGLCIAYATLVRANAAFCTIPLIVFLIPKPQHPGLKFGMIAVGTAATLLVSPLINHEILGARDSGTKRAEAIYDLSAIAVKTYDPVNSGISEPGIRALATNHCSKPFFWDPLFIRKPCIDAVRGLNSHSPIQLYIMLAKAIVLHPLAYTEHRLAHLNSTERWLVPAKWPLAEPPSACEPNSLSLAGPTNHLASFWQSAASEILESPLGWPVVWIALGVWGIYIAFECPPSSSGNVALALLASALGQEASFAVLSIASDFRYHLWPMVATAIAWILLWPDRRTIGQSPLPAIVLGLIVAAGIIARIVLPVAPSDYSAMLL